MLHIRGKYADLHARVFTKLSNKNNCLKNKLLKRNT